MAITTDAVMANTVPTILERAQYTHMFESIMRNLVWKIRKELHDGKNVNVPKFGTVTARSLTEGVDNTTSETMSDTLVTVTPGEVGLKLIVTDKLVRDNQEDIKAAAGRIAGEAYTMKEDEDLLLQLASAGTTMGAGSTLTMGQIAASRATVRGVPVSSGGPWRGSVAFVQHPYTLLDLVDVLTPLAPSLVTSGTAEGIQGMPGSLTESVLRTGIIGSLFGVPIYEDGNIDTASIANTAKGGLLATGEGSAIILATAKDWDIEPERDASLRATELNLTGEYGVGIYEADWMVTANNDATAPA